MLLVLVLVVTEMCVRVCVCARAEEVKRATEVTETCLNEGRSEGSVLSGVGVA